jgi:hypothetical protein
VGFSEDKAPYKTAGGIWPRRVTATRDAALADWKEIEPLIAWCDQYFGAPLSWP